MGGGRAERAGDREGKREMQVQTRMLTREEKRRTTEREKNRREPEKGEGKREAEGMREGAFNWRWEGILVQGVGRWEGRKGRKGQLIGLK